MNEQADKFSERYNALRKIRLIALKAIGQIANKWKIEKLALANLGFRFKPWSNVCRDFVVVYSRLVYVCWRNG